MKQLTLTACYIVTVLALTLPISAPPSQSEEKLAEPQYHQSITVNRNAEQRARASLTSERSAKPLTAGSPQTNLPLKGIGAPPPDRRIGAATRGPCKTAPTLAVLAPYPAGPTAHEQPALYWFVSAAVTNPIDFSLTDEDEKVFRPLFETRIAPPVQPGVHQVRLAGSEVRLEPGKQYKWSVAVVCDPEHPSQDIVAMGFIERAKGPNETGLWYDEVMAISDLIEAAPTDMNLRLKRASLFEQVKLSDVAAYDLKTKVGDAR